MNTDKFRKAHLAMAEAIDAWRVIPRAMVAGYAYLVYKVIDWYMDLHPYFIDGCAKEITRCFVDAPSTQHSVLVSAVIGLGAAIIGFYVNTGRKWNEPFIKWDDTKKLVEKSVE